MEALADRRCSEMAIVAGSRLCYARDVVLPRDSICFLCLGTGGEILSTSREHVMPTVLAIFLPVLSPAKLWQSAIAVFVSQCLDLRPAA